MPRSSRLPIVAILGCLVPLTQFASASAAQPASKFHGTVRFTGSMTSDTTLVMNGALSVGNATNLDWDLPVVSSIRLNGYSESVKVLTFVFSVTPDSTVDVVEPNGLAVRRFHWNTPPQNTRITVAETLRVSVHTTLTPFHSNAAFPLVGLPTIVSSSLAITDGVRLPASADKLVSRLGRSGKSEAAVVSAVAGWVATHTRYNLAAGNGPADAATIFTSRLATCTGYSDLMTGLLRRLGIPTQIQYGWVSAQPLMLPGPHHTTFNIRWGNPGSQGELHAWLNVYFPDKGWVPFDPQSEKFFVDSRHIAFFPVIDAAIDMGFGSWQADTLSSDTLTGQTNIVPANGLDSKVTLHSTDSIHVSYRSSKSDVKNIVMFAR